MASAKIAIFEPGASKILIIFCAGVVKIPIIGIGGIACASDVIEFILAGADLVQIGTLNYKNPNIGIEILDDLKAFCIKHKISNLSNLKGKLIYHNE